MGYEPGGGAAGSADGPMEVHFTRLQMSQADMSLAWRSLEDHLEDLETDLRNLLGDWASDSNAEYTAVRNRWRQAATDMSNVLNFTAAERANIDIWSR